MTLSMTRRRASALIVTILGAALALTGCSSSGSPQSDDVASASADEGAFPVTVEDQFGDVTLESQPERVVILDNWYIDPLLALDVQPVAIRSYGDSEDAGVKNMLADQPWLEGRYTGTIDTTLISADSKAVPEAVAAWEPDLIIGAAWMMDEDIYAQLSQIAPTWARPSGMSDDDVWSVFGELTGHSDEAESIIQGVDDAYAATAAELPGLAGKTFIGVRVEDTLDMTAGGIGPWARLGMVPADNTPDVGTVTSLSMENLDQLDADLVTFGT